MSLPIRSCARWMRSAPVRRHLWLVILGGAAWVLLAYCSVRPGLIVRAAALQTGSAKGGEAVSPAAGALMPDEACARCHAQIYATYERTSMARGSGTLNPATLGTQLRPGSFLHRASGIEYTVRAANGRAAMTYVRGPTAIDEGRNSVLAQPAGGSAEELRGERELSYWIGSGKHGRTYLYQVDGSWFELPINYYSRRQQWDMAPAFDNATTMPADLPTDPNCLHCHATGVAVALPGARSRYAGAPFAEGGIGCSACHGDPSAHLAGAGRGPIVNPGRLDPARRESACLACHLEGDAVVYRAGRSLAQFQPGQDLSETAIYFVRASQAGGGGRAASQYEALLRSACRRAAGDRLTCTTCHDPHAAPGAAERVGYYRAKCLACHSDPAIATRHHPEQPDCAICHMPVRATADISHEQSVDHDIERVPAAGDASQARQGELLLPVGGWKSSDRELGLAYAQMAERGDRPAGARALTLLARAEAEGASDAALHTQLGFLRQMAGDREKAAKEYEAALAHNPDEPSALANLAVLNVTSGAVGKGRALLQRLVARDPSQTAAGLNLAFIDCRVGDARQANAVLDLLARYNPDDGALRTFRQTNSYGGQRCDLRAAGGVRTHE